MGKGSKTKEQIISEMDELRQMIDDFQDQDSSYKKLNDQLQAEIIAHKQAEKELKESEERYRLLYERSPLGYQSLDSDGNLIEVNPAWLSLLGYEKKDVIGRSFADFLASGFPELFKERFPCFKASGEACSVPFVMICKDGRRIDVEIDGKIGYNPDGSFRQTHCVVRDITERKKAEAELKESEEELENIFNLSPDMICVCTPEGKFLKVSPSCQRVLGYTQEEILKSGWTKLIHPDDVEPTYKEVAKQLKGASVANFVNRYKHKDGSYRIFEWHATPSINGIVYASARDITERKQAEEKLKESEEQFRSLVRNVPGVTYRCRCDEHWTMEFISDEIEILSGYPATDFIGNKVRSYASIIDSEDRQISDAQALEKIALKEPYTVEYRIIAADGTARWCFEKGQGVFDEQGELSYLDGVIVDITERKRTEQLRSLKLKILDKINNSIVWKDSIEDIVNEIKEFTGFEAVGLRLHEGEDFPYYVTQGFPAQFVEAENYLCNRDSKGEIIRDSDGNPYVECMCGNVICGRIDTRKDFFTDGGSFWSNNTSKLLAESTDEDRQTRTRNRCNSEGYESVALIPLKTGREVIGLIQLNDKRTNRFTMRLIQTMEDIGISIGTAFLRKQAEKELENLSKFPSENPNPVLRITKDGEVLYSNEAGKTLLAKWETEVGKTVPEKWCNLTAEAFTSGKGIEEEAIKDKVFSIVISPVKEAGYANLYASDITDRKQAEKELETARHKAESANIAKSRFLANMSHEIRSPMNIISGFTDLLANEEMTDDQHEYARLIKKAGKSLLNIIDEILDYSKIEAGKLEVRHEQFSLKKLLGDIDSMMRILVDEKDVEFKVIGDERLPSIIRSDSARIHQCLVNLINNAIKYTDHGHIHLKVSLQHKDRKPFIRFDVEDTGIGIPVDEQENIFASFRQVNESDTRVHGGTGLGLAITRKLAKLLGGELTVTSEEDKGSVFSLLIPAGVDVKSQPSIGEEEPQVKPIPENYTVVLSGKVLVAEDIQESRLVIDKFLKPLGLEVTLAEDGNQAIEKAREQTFDLILMDIRMPKLNGLEATRILRKEGITTPIIAQTAYAMTGDREKCLEAGCDDYITKPIDREKLTHILYKYIGQVKV